MRSRAEAETGVGQAVTVGLAGAAVAIAIGGLCYLLVGANDMFPGGPDEDDDDWTDFFDPPWQPG